MVEKLNHITRPGGAQDERHQGGIDIEDWLGENLEQETAPEHRRCEGEQDESAADPIRIGVRKQKNVKAQGGYGDPTQRKNWKADEDQNHSPDQKISAVQGFRVFLQDQGNTCKAGQQYNCI